MVTRPAKLGSRMAAAAWVFAALLAMSSVLILNGRPLFYYDTVGYVDQGQTALEKLGLLDRPDAEQAEAGQAEGGAKVRTIDGSRSVFYSILAGVANQLGLFEAILAVNVGALLAATWLLAGIIHRTVAPLRSRAGLSSLPLIVASLGALPFYAAYLMPDLMTPVMILAFATLAAFHRVMQKGELAAAFLLGSLALISHLSNLGVGALMVLGVAMVSMAQSRARWWLAPLIVAAVVGVGFAQQAALRLAAEKADGASVVIKPFITARLIADGPGFEWLQSHCPDAAVPTCSLWTALQKSDDPYRLTASHIVFETSERLGSFRLMSDVEQKAVADAQVAFFKTVLRDRPVAVTLALLRNTLKQSTMMNIDMTLPSDQIIAQNISVTGAISGPLSHGRLTADLGWVGDVVQGQGIVYVGSLAVVMTLLLLPGAVAPSMRAFAVAIVLGLLANAFVCGAISQPATRYGARVIWLLPMLAGLMLMVASQRRDEAAR